MYPLYYNVLYYDVLVEEEFQLVGAYRVREPSICADDLGFTFSINV